MIPSEEQIKICRAIENNCHTIVCSVPGSGKSTLILSIASLCDDKRMMAITYNAGLKFEVREKIKYEGLKNIEAHSYHSLAVKYYSKHAHTDIGINDILKHNLKPIALPQIDILAIDEKQDCMGIYYQFIRKLVRDLGMQPTLLFLGDVYQDLYAFKQADRRYLTLAPALWDLPFQTLKMSISYRLTPAIAAFVNDIIGYERIKAFKTSTEPVTYIKTSDSKACQIILNDILPLLYNNTIQPSDIFVLAASTKQKTLKLLENLFVSHHIPCYVSGNDDAKLDADIVRKKCIFTSLCQSKGQEKKYVILLGFDASYFKYFGKNVDPTQCPSNFYVGMTRASQKLYVVEGKDGPLPFLNKTHDELKQLSYIKFIGKSSMKVMEKKPSSLHMTSPTDLVKYLDLPMMNRLTPLVNDLFVVEQPASKMIDIPNKILTNGNYEEVCDLNGLIIPAMYEYKTQQTNTLMHYLSETKVKKHPLIQNAIHNLTICESIEDFTRLAVIYFSARNKLYFKLEQIHRYDWLSKNMIDSVHDYMHNLLHKDLTYEIELEHRYELYETGPIQISGVVDCVDGDVVYELKCTSELTLEHQLQLIIYAWLWTQTRKDIKIFKLFNIKSGEVRTLQNKNLTSIVEMLLLYKYKIKTLMSDEEFISQKH